MKMLNKVVMPLVMVACLSGNVMANGILDTAVNTSRSANESKRIVLERVESIEKLTYLNYVSAKVKLFYLKRLREANNWGEGPSVTERNNAVHYSRIIVGAAVSSGLGLWAAASFPGNRAAGLVAKFIPNSTTWNEFKEAFLMFAARGAVATVVATCSFRLIASDIDTYITPGYSQEYLAKLIVSSQTYINSSEYSAKEAGRMLSEDDTEFTLQEDQEFLDSVSEFMLDNPVINALDCDLLG